MWGRIGKSAQRETVPKCPDSTEKCFRLVSLWLTNHVNKYCESNTNNTAKLSFTFLTPRFINLVLQVILSSRMQSLITRKAEHCQQSEM